MAWIQVGTCPQCGAPIYEESPWHGVLPPPPRYTCNCAHTESGYKIVSSGDTK